MKNLKHLWWIGALALLAACDPYSDENTGTPEILSVFASSGTSDGIDGVIEATAPTAPSTTWTFDAASPVPAGNTVFYVKTNKLLDGASIQTTWDSCVPAAGTNLTVNGAPADATWFMCYMPTAGTAAEGASVVIYQGADIQKGVSGTGFFDAAALTVPAAPATGYTITATVKDKQGHELPISIDAVTVQ